VPSIAPVPPRQNRRKSTKTAPVRGSIPLIAAGRNWFQPAQTRSASGSARAIMIDSRTSSHIWLPKTVAAGNRGLMSDPSRNTVCIDAKSPALVGIDTPLALSSMRKAIEIAPIAEAAGMFVNPAAWSSLSEKSNVMSEPSIVTVTAMRRRRVGSMPSDCMKLSPR
jgi:hypothetical protein